MFAVIYQGYIKAGCESQYQKAWHQVAQYFVEQRGAIGSCLHRTSDGLWLAYSRWPDKKTRDASWPGEAASSSVLPSDIREAIMVIKDSIDQDRNYQISAWMSSMIYYSTKNSAEEQIYGQLRKIEHASLNRHVCLQPKMAKVRLNTVSRLHGYFENQATHRMRLFSSESCLL